MKFRTRALSLLLVLLLCVFSLTGCLKYTSNLLEVTGAVNEAASAFDAATANYQYSQVPASYPVATDYYSVPASSSVPAASTASVAASTSAAATQATQPASQAPQTTAAATKDPSQWTKAEIVEYLSKAVNAAKAYTGGVSVEHSEAFSSLDITKCPGGSIGINLANKIASGVIKPTTETLNFSGGRATNSEGDSVPLLLPKREAFSLTADGVQSASATKNNGQTMIELTLVSESSTLQQKPQHNSKAIGYLDPSEVDLSIVSIDQFNVTYSGSKIIATIDAQDRVVSIAYTIPVVIDVVGSALGISGSFACIATETENWKVNWQ